MSNTNNSKPAKKPVFRKILPGGISAAVFENQHDGRTYRSVNIQRSYKKNGQWNRMSMYLDHEHIPFMIEVLQGTWQYLNSTSPTSESESVAETSENTESTPIDDQIPEYES